MSDPLNGVCKLFLNQNGFGPGELLTHEWRCRNTVGRWGRVRGSGLKDGHVGGKQQLAAAVLTEQNRKEDAGCAALIKGRGHPVKHGVHLAQQRRDNSMLKYKFLLFAHVDLSSLTPLLA